MKADTISPFRFRDFTILHCKNETHNTALTIFAQREKNQATATKLLRILYIFRT